MLELNNTWGFSIWSIEETAEEANIAVGLYLSERDPEVVVRGKLV